MLENICFPLKVQGVELQKREARAHEVIELVGLEGRENSFPRQLSGGQQQLVGVARAIIGQPKLLLADEPTGNLHSEQGARIMDIFKQLNEEGMTIIQVTHYERNAAYGSRIVRLEDGQIEEDIKTEGIQVPRVE